ncbi:MAG: hypothetical protein K5796_01865 [Lachnospiraceae bacterium]|nr:hypothetical protein [Lachnospiraceae bacterium]
MADQANPAIGNETANEKKKIKEEKQRLKQEEKKQRQEIKKRAKEISKRESELADEEEPGGASSFVVTTIIVLVWIAILGFLIKLDVGGFGSEILTPILKDVPVVNLILPKTGGTVTPADPNESYGGYNSIKDAVEYIKVLELELEHAQNVNNTYTEELTKLQAEVERLREFESMQVEFQRIKEQFFEEIIYSDNGPGAEGYKKYYESIDPTTAEALYKQVVTKLEIDAKYKDFVSRISQQKPKAAAAEFDNLVSTDSKMLAEILMSMDSDAAAKILAAMQPANAAILIKIMNPNR